MDRVVQGSVRQETAFSDGALEPLPPPVVRYFRRVLRDRQPAIRVARLLQRGQFRSKESVDPAAGWRPFTATQVFSADPPGFVWDARIRMAPFMDVQVRDACVDGRASMVAALLAVIPVVDESDRDELREGALHRYLAESVWFPTALLPRDGIEWSEIDDSHARATLTDGNTSVSLDFEFAPGGEIVAAFTPGRLRALSGQAGQYERRPWGGRYGRYEDREGIRVPTEAEVYWVTEGREQPYYRGRLVSVEYEYDAGR
jgi:hypothetical protein